VDTYIAVDVLKNEDNLVVLYEGSTIINPPENDFIHWKLISKAPNPRDDTIDEDWHTFRQIQPDQHRELLDNFADSAVVDYLRNSYDVLAVFPSAERVANSNSLEPVLTVIKKAVGLSSISPYCANLILSNGKALRLVEQENWFYFMMQNSSSSKMSSSGSLCKISVGSGISSPDNDNEYGTIGGFATNEVGETFLITAEHVSLAIQRSESKKPLKLQNMDVEVTIPSRGPRKLALIQAVEGKLATNTPLNAKFLECILTHYHSDVWKDMLNCRSGDILIQDLVTYLNENQVSIHPRRDSIRTCSVARNVKYGEGVISIIGDVAAIPIAASEIEHFDLQSSPVIKKPIKGIYSMDDMYQEWTNGVAGEITVYKRGANDSKTRVEGLIRRPIHIKKPMDYSEKRPVFLCERRSQHLKDDPSLSSEVKDNFKLLLGQYLVQSSPDFGVGGDSGSMVYAESDSAVFIVGTFVGSFNNDGYFVVSPADVLCEGLKWNCVV